MSASMIGAALHAEWTKLRTTASTGWLLLGAVALSMLVSVAAVAAVRCPSAACPADPARLSLTGIDTGQAVVALLAVLAISDEYATGMIQISFIAMPRRLSMLAAKAVILTIAIVAAGAIAVLGSLSAGRVILSSRGYTAAHGFLPLSSGDGPVLRAAVGSILYLALIGLLSLGIATAVRHPAVAIGAVLGLLYAFPVVAALVGNPRWQERIDQLGPMTAGLGIQVTTDLRRLPFSPWAGLGITAAWAVAALLIGGLLLRLRDA